MKYVAGQWINQCGTQGSGHGMMRYTSHKGDTFLIGLRCIMMYQKEW